MSAAAQLSLEEYLRTVYEPECDYIDGSLQDRHTGLALHGETVACVGGFFHNHRRRLGVRVAIALRMLVAPSRVRVPDISIIDADDHDEIQLRPPHLCIEVRSPEDNSGRLEQALDDYFGMGVPEVWVLDPYVLRAFVVTREDRVFRETAELDWRGLAIPLTELLPD